MSGQVARGYFLSILGFGLGLVQVAFVRLKQGWHDKRAGIVVVWLRPGTDVVRLTDPGTPP